MTVALKASAKSITSSKRKRRRSQTSMKSSRKKVAPKPRRTLHVRDNPSDNAHEKICIRSSPLPDNFVFVPKGDPYITRHCKSRSKDVGSIVYIVYDSKLQNQLGIRVASTIYASVLQTASQTAHTRASAVQQRDIRDRKRAHTVLSETFPNIPASCAEEILQHSFLKGSRRVGRTGMKPEKVKVTLAVEAHIRHKHTPYERVLKDGNMQREEARREVWELVKGMREEWAGKSLDG